MNAGSVQGGRTLVADNAKGEDGQDRCESGQPRQLRHVPLGRVSGAGRLVPEIPESGQWSAFKIRSGVDRANRREGPFIGFGVYLKGSGQYCSSCSNLVVVMNNTG